MSWESTQTYYRLINQKVRDELGGLHSAKLVLYSVDFAEIEALQHQGDWEAARQLLPELNLSGPACGYPEYRGADRRDGLTATGEKRYEMARAWRYELSSCPQSCHPG